MPAPVRSLVLAAVLLSGTGCGESAASPPPASTPPAAGPPASTPPAPGTPPAEPPPPAAPTDTRAESCEAELHVCGPTWLGCVHVRAAGATPDGRARFEGDDGVFYETRRDCRDGRCTDHCPGGVCRPGVTRAPEAPMVCSVLSGPPAPATFVCTLVDHACVRTDASPPATTSAPLPLPPGPPPS